MNNSNVLKLEIAEVKENSLGPEYSSTWSIFQEMRQGKAGTFLKFTVREKKASIQSQATCDGMTVKDKGNRKRRKLGRKAKDLRRLTSESGFPPMMARRRKC